MKIAVISDIHGNLLALQAVLHDIAKQGADQIINLGDILSGPLQPAETAGLLMAKNFVTIAGNHERQLLQVWDAPSVDLNLLTSDGYSASKIIAAHAQWLRALPAFYQLMPDVLMVHGTPSSDLEYWLETVTPDFHPLGSPGMRAAHTREVEERMRSMTNMAATSLVLCGHTHVPRCVQLANMLIVNPGSVGLQAYASDAPHLHHVENGSPHARYAIVERCSQGWRVQLCAVPYDWATQAHLAQERGRPDWACALATGRMPSHGLPQVDDGGKLK